MEYKTHLGHGIHVQRTRECAGVLGGMSPVILTHDKGKDRRGKPSEDRITLEVEEIKNLLRFLGVKEGS